MNYGNITQWRAASRFIGVKPYATSAASFVRTKAGVTRQLPVYQSVVVWFLLCPLLIFVARQFPILDGPAKEAASKANAQALALQRGSHVYTYVALVLLMVIVFTNFKGVWSALKCNVPLAASLLLAAASVFWSSTPLVTLEMAFKVTISTMFACYLSSRFTAERLMAILMFVGVTASALSIFFVFALPRYGVFAGYAGGAWQGICDHKNTLGISTAYLLTPAFFYRPRKLRGRSLYIIFLLCIIAASQSRGAWIDTLAMLSFVGFLHVVRRLRAAELRLTLVVAAVGIAIICLVVGTYFEQITLALGKDPSMGGRTQIYYELGKSLLKKPFLGYGFGAFWSATGVEANRVRSAVGWPIGYAESGLFEVALQTGLVGLGLMLLMVGRAALQGARLLRSEYYSPKVGWFLTILFLALMTNIEAGWLLIENNLDWTLICIACIGLSREVKIIDSLKANFKEADEAFIPSNNSPNKILEPLGA